jgi:ubiquitin C-terminal hydrolase
MIILSFLPRYCPKCKDFRVSLKKIEIWKVPNILVVHIKRFMYTKTKRGKIRTRLDFPMRDWNLSKLISGEQKHPPIYDLFAVCNHEGTLGQGHYTTLAKNRDDKNWYNFDDSLVTEVDLSGERVSWAFPKYF